MLALSALAPIVTFWWQERSNSTLPLRRLISWLHWLTKMRFLKFDALFGHRMSVSPLLTGRLFHWQRSESMCFQKTGAQVGNVVLQKLEQNFSAICYYLKESTFMLEISLQACKHDLWRTRSCFGCWIKRLRPSTYFFFNPICLQFFLPYKAS